MQRMEERRRRRWFLAAAVVAVGVLLVASEIAIASLRRFWVEHPMLTALAAFAITLSFTVLVVDALLEKRGAGRWQNVGEVAIRRLSGDAFLACAGTIHLFGFSGQDERMADAFDRVAASGERPGTPGVSPLLPEGFEEAVVELLNEPSERERCADVIDDLLDVLDQSMARWAPVMLRSGELAEMLNIFSLKREVLSWVGSSLRRVDKSSQHRLDFWSNLRVYLALFASFDSLRRSALREPSVFGTTLDDHDDVWGLPFSEQRAALAARGQQS
jgi:hypothetical protein